MSFSSKNSFNSISAKTDNYSYIQKISVMSINSSVQPFALPSWDSWSCITMRTALNDLASSFSMKNWIHLMNFLNVFHRLLMLPDGRREIVLICLFFWLPYWLESDMMLTVCMVLHLRKLQLRTRHWWNANF